MCTRTVYCLIIAYLNLVCSILAAISFTVYLVNKELLKEIADAVHSSRAAVQGVLAFLLAVSVLMVVISAMLVKGINKSRHRLMLPWLLSCAISIGCSLMINFIILFRVNNPAPRFVSGMISLTIQCVIIYPIYTLYRDLKTENQIFERTGRTV